MITTVTIGEDKYGTFLSVSVNGSEIYPPSRPNSEDPADLFHDVIHVVLSVASASGISPVLGTLAHALDERPSDELRNYEEDAVIAIGKYINYASGKGD